MSAEPTAARLRRAERIIELRDRDLQKAEAAAAAAARAVVEAKQRARDAEEAWQAAATTMKPATVQDMVETDAYLRTLRVRAERALGEVVACRTEEERKMKELLVAKAEKRKLEIWRDGIRAGLEANAERVERAATDAIAARRARGAT